MDVININHWKKAKQTEEEDTPHLSGEAVCGACGHQWAAVAPIGTIHLDCPSCGRCWGLYKNAVEPAAGDAMWRCNCGEVLFFIIPSGCLCRKCGCLQKF